MILAKELKTTLMTNISSGHLILSSYGSQGATFGITCKWGDSIGYAAFENDANGRKISFLSTPTEQVIDFGDNWEILVDEKVKPQRGFFNQDDSRRYGVFVVDSGSYLNCIFEGFGGLSQVGYITLANLKTDIRFDVVEYDKSLYFGEPRLLIGGSFQGTNAPIVFDPWDL